MLISHSSITSKIYVGIELFEFSIHIPIAKGNNGIGMTTFNVSHERIDFCRKCLHLGIVHNTQLVISFANQHN